MPPLFNRLLAEVYRSSTAFSGLLANVLPASEVHLRVDALILIVGEPGRVGLLTTVRDDSLIPAFRRVLP